MNTLLIQIDEQVFAKIGEKARDYGMPTAQPNLVLRKMFDLDTAFEILNQSLKNFQDELGGHIQGIRIVNALRHRNIITVGDLVNRTEGQVRVAANIGLQSINLIKEFLAKKNLSFRNEYY